MTDTTPRDRARRVWATVRLFVRGSFEIDDPEFAPGQRMKIPRYTTFATTFPRIDHIGVRELPCGCSKRIWKRKAHAVLLDCSTHGVASWGDGKYAGLWADVRKGRASADHDQEG